MRIGFALLAGLLTACGLSVVGVAADDVTGGADASMSSSSGAPLSTADASLGDATLDSAAPPTDAATDEAAPPGPIFGDDCPTGTTYVDDFSTDPTGRWVDGAATWTWSSVDKTFTVTNINPQGAIWIGPRPKWTNYSVEMSIRVSNPNSVNGGNAGPLFRITNWGPPPPANNAGQMFLAAVVLNGADDVIFGTENNGWTQNAQINDGATPVNQWLTIRAAIQGSAITVYTNDQLRLSVTNSAYANGSIGIKTYGLALSVREVTVTCL